MSIGEFAFGLDRDTVKDAHPVRLISPVAGKRIPADVRTPFRFSPQGLATHHTVKIVNASKQTTVFDGRVTADRAFATLQDTGTYYWYVESSYEPTGRVTAGSPVDSFVVAGPFVELVRPASAVVWTKDSAYAISWETNVQGTVAIELQRADTNVAIVAENIPTGHGGFLWRVPVSVPVGEGYQIVVRTIPTAGDGPTVTSTFTVSIKDQIVGVAEGHPIIRTTIAPNPTTDRVYIGGDQPLSEVALYAITGVQVMRELVTGTGHSIDVSLLAPGAYTLVLRTNNRTEHHTLVITR
jgi:hypothetical protein